MCDFCKESLYIVPLCGLEPLWARSACCMAGRPGWACWSRLGWGVAVAGKARGSVQTAFPCEWGGWVPGRDFTSWSWGKMPVFWLRAFSSSPKQWACVGRVGLLAAGALGCASCLWQQERVRGSQVSPCGASGTSWGSLQARGEDAVVGCKAVVLEAAGTKCVGRGRRLFVWGVRFHKSVWALPSPHNLTPRQERKAHTDLCWEVGRYGACQRRGIRA